MTLGGTGWCGCVVHGHVPVSLPSSSSTPRGPWTVRWELAVQPGVAVANRDAAPQASLPCGRSLSPKIKAFPSCPGVWEQPEDPAFCPSQYPTFREFWGTPAPPLFTSAPPFIPAHSHEEEQRQERLCCPSGHKGMNEQRGRKWPLTQPPETPHTCPDPWPGAAFHYSWVSWGPRMAGKRGGSGLAAGPLS